MKSKDCINSNLKQKHILVGLGKIPFIPEGLAVTPLSGRELGSWIFSAGESCAAAKPSLVTFENSFLSPTSGGLDDVTGELPKAIQGEDENNKQVNNWTLCKQHS